MGKKENGLKSVNIKYPLNKFYSHDQVMSLDPYLPYNTRAKESELLLKLVYQEHGHSIRAGISLLLLLGIMVRAYL